MSSSFQMWSATRAAIAAAGDLGCQAVGSVKLTHYQLTGGVGELALVYLRAAMTMSSAA
jgi:hypothetical protein